MKGKSAPAMKRPKRWARKSEALDFLDSFKSIENLVGDRIGGSFTIDFRGMRNKEKYRKRIIRALTNRGYGVTWSFNHEHEPYGACEMGYDLVGKRRNL